MDIEERCCVLIPFKDRFEDVARCLQSLELQLSDEVDILLVDDGSSSNPAEHPHLKCFLDSNNNHLIRHSANRGVSAARNTGIRWCMQHGYALVLMIDSDCVAPPNYVEMHLSLHRRHPDIPVIGGAIRGVGSTLWATLDRMMTWFHVIPGSPERELPAPYILPTANVSIKIHMLPFGDTFFESRLRTGEDSAFSNRVRNAGFRILFSPTPEIEHKDRNTLRDFLRHQYEFGRHHFYTSHMNRGLTHLCFNPLYRLVFSLAFVVGLPFYAVLGCLLNIRPWLRHDPFSAVYWPLMQLVWLVKGAAVLEAIFFQRKAFRLD